MILVFGSYNAGPVFRMDRTPVPGQTFIAYGLTVQPDGEGANQAVAAAVAMVGAVGDDALAAAALDRLRAAGVDLSGVRCLADIPTGYASICTDREGRDQVAVALAANAALVASDIPDVAPGPHVTVPLQMESDTVASGPDIRRARQQGAGSGATWRRPFGSIGRYWQ